MKKRRKQKQKKAPGNNSGSALFYKLTFICLAISTVTLAASLFVYHYPTIEALIKAYSAKLEEAAAVASPDSAEKIVTETSDKLPEEETVPFLVSSGEVGEISDLSGENTDWEGGVTYTAMLDTSMGPMLYYNQGDKRWADFLYGGSDPMKKYGCGPTAVSMVINSFTSESVTPPDLANWSAANKGYAVQSGSYHRLIPDSLSAYGLKVTSVKDYSYGHAAELLQTGHILVALMGKGSLTDNGHFILITKFLENGNVNIADPNSYENSTKEWDLNQLLSELKKNYDSGAPLWAVNFPE